jgi:hypothetical protein
MGDAGMAAGHWFCRKTILELLGAKSYAAGRLDAFHRLPGYGQARIAVKLGR